MSFNTALVSRGDRPNLMDSIAKQFSEDMDQDVVTLWDMAVAMTGVKDRPFYKQVIRARKSLEISDSSV